jgi:hypothetical protein
VRGAAGRKKRQKTGNCSCPGFNELKNHIIPNIDVYVLFFLPKLGLLIILVDCFVD